MVEEKMRYIFLLFDAAHLIGQDHEAQAAQILQALLQEISEPKMQEGKQ